ncbi:hypothetical protein R1flu_002355 [Riccia fluitans]|uniref:Uncharacterized protein n=1 Tax=Riccia fluitans TaxID=41844 RepID=A0ABD1Y621_9MARC
MSAQTNWLGRGSGALFSIREADLSNANEDTVSYREIRPGTDKNPNAVGRNLELMGSVKLKLELSEKMEEGEKET